MDQITRSQLKAVVRRTIDVTMLEPESSWGGETYEVPLALKRELIDVANTVQRLSVTWQWTRLEDEGEDQEFCGCLIGTVRKRRGQSPAPSRKEYPQRRVEAILGMNFIQALHDVVPGMAESIFEVIDD